MCELGGDFYSGGRRPLTSVRAPAQPGATQLDTGSMGTPDGMWQHLRDRLGLPGAHANPARPPVEQGHRWFAMPTFNHEQHR